MGILRSAKQAGRPIRRRVTPGAFKERYINSALSRADGGTYLEIGVRWGESMRAVRASRKIGVDPLRHPNLEKLRPTEEFYECPSDDFFAEVAPSILALRSVNVALVDGLHEFGQALRDVLNLEPYMSPGGLIVLDDCNPQSEAMAVDVPTGGAWNGDVWKVMLLIRNEFCDLGAITLDRDQGVGLVWGFADRNSVRPVEPEVLRKYKELPYSELERDRSTALGLTRVGIKALRESGVPV